MPGKKKIVKSIGGGGGRSGKKKQPWRGKNFFFVKKNLAEKRKSGEGRDLCNGPKKKGGTGSGNPRRVFCGTNLNRHKVPKIKKSCLSNRREKIFRAEKGNIETNPSVG